MKIFSITFLCLSVIATVIQAQNTKEELRNLMETNGKECIANGIGSDEDLAMILKRLKATSHEMMCLRNCIFKKLGLYDDNGNFLKSVAMSLIAVNVDDDAEKMKTAEEIVDSCMENDVPDDQCEATEQIAMCMMEKAKERNAAGFE